MITTRTFGAAVVVLVLMMTLVKRVSEPPKLFGNYASLQWATVQVLNGCLVNGADLLEQRYAEYRALIAKRETDPLAFKFLEFGMGSGEPIPPKGAAASPCNTGGVYHDELAEAQTTANDYAKTYAALRPVAEQAERLFRPGLDNEFSPEVNEQLRRLIDQTRIQSIPFRQALEQPQLVVRAQQLQTIEASKGHDQHWHTLRFMLLARQTINALDAMASGASLTPLQLLAMQQSLDNTRLEADAFVKALPRLRAKGDKPPIWSVTTASAKDWLDQLARLQQHWAAGADAPELNKDLADARAGYDLLLTTYNAAVGSDY